MLAEVPGSWKERKILLLPLRHEIESFQDIFIKNTSSFRYFKCHSHRLLLDGKKTFLTETAEEHEREQERSKEERRTFLAVMSKYPHTSLKCNF